ncbi:MAG: hypothetical protein IJQ37_01595 [Clostridia bacterium]|nr:hypothetical protein [Clostridia bacterium]
MKKTLKLIPAIVMLLISAILVSTSTYAWFSMNSNVTATGMSVQAKAEGGIVISNANGSVWSNTANAVTASAVLYPTSTKDVTSWYHNKSTNADDAQASQAASTYETLTLTKSATTYGVGYVEDGTAGYDGTEAAYYLLNTFTIKSSSENMSGITFYINSVSVTGTNTSAALDASLRVAIKIAGDSSTYIYAPVTGATTNYKVGGSDQTAITVKTASDKNVATAINAISTTGIGVEIYAYFEGEDAACKSTNASGLTLDDLAVTVVFGTATITP